MPALPRKSGAFGGSSLPLPVTTKLVSSGSSIVDAHGAQRVGHVARVVALQRAGQAAGALGEAASSSARLVIDFEPGGTARPTSGCLAGMMVSFLSLLMTLVSSVHCAAAVRP